MLQAGGKVAKGRHHQPLSTHMHLGAMLLLCVSSRFCQSALELQNCSRVPECITVNYCPPAPTACFSSPFLFFTKLDSWHRPPQSTPSYVFDCICSCNQLRHLDQEEQAREQSCCVGTGGCSLRGLHVWVWDSKDGREIEILVNNSGIWGWCISQMEVRKGPSH